LDQHFRSLIENASDAISVVAPSLEIVLQAGSATKLLGYTPAELEGTKFSALVEPASLATLRATCAAVADGLTVQPVELRLRHRDGAWIDVETAIRHDPDIGYLVLTTRDARERKRAERKLRRQAHQQAVVAALGARALEGGDLPRMFLEAAGEIKRTLDAHYVGVHQHVSERDVFVQFAGVGLDDEIAAASVLPADDSHLGATLRSSSGLIVPDWSTETRFSDVPFFRSHGFRGGISVPVPGTWGPFGVLTVQSARLGQFNYEDIVFLQAVANIFAAAIARSEDEEKIRHQALHDPVTGLPNRILFEDRLTRALASARRRERQLAVLFLDLDNFKRVNDSLGHATGDEVLIASARRLANCLRDEDTLARFGGDEFVVLLPEIACNQDWVPVAKRIQETLQIPLEVEGRTIMTSVSVGAAIGGHGQPDKDAAALVRDADLAMYAAKQRGPGRQELFADEMYTSAVERLDLIGDLHAGLERGEFEAFFQPIVSLSSETVVGVEALARWNHPREGMLGPGTFLPLAEETGLIVQLGHQILRQACEAVRSWQDSDPRYAAMYLSANLSSPEVHSPSLIAAVRTILDETGFDPKRLVLEITEGVLLKGDDDALGRLLELKSMGIRLAVDDFGTGYSALSYIQNFPIDILKIDKTFIDHLDDHEDQRRLVNGIIELAHGVNLETIAEGIETPAQAALLRRMDAGLGQGFHFARPVSRAEMDALIADYPWVSHAGPDVQSAA
jgi:diguanylate cyclase (GGDEF)-like protein/PAS domain S-box-containing protein